MNLSTCKNNSWFVLSCLFCLSLGDDPSVGKYPTTPSMRESGLIEMRRLGLMSTLVTNNVFTLSFSLFSFVCFVCLYGIIFQINYLFLFLFMVVFYPILPYLQFTNDAVDPTTWRNRNVQVVGWFVVGIVSILLLESFHYISCADVFSADVYIYIILCDVIILF